MLPLSVTSTGVRGGGRSGEALRSGTRPGAPIDRKISPLHFVPVEMTEGAFASAVAVTSTGVHSRGRSGEALRSGVRIQREISPLHFVPVEMTKGAFVPVEMTGESAVPVEMTGVTAGRRAVKANL